MASSPLFPAPMKGVSLGFMARKGYYRGDAGRAEIDAIADLGATHVALIVTIMQEAYYSTRMFHDFTFSPSDREVADAIAAFHRRGVKVLLKPMVECHDSVWRGCIRFPGRQSMIAGVEADYWSAWFHHYTACMTHYAQLAQDEGVDLFCVGCELAGCEPQEDDWPGVIDRVRSLYRGPVVYNANQYVPGEPFVRGWFKRLDALGISFYTGVDASSPSAEAVAEALRPVADRLEREVHGALGIPVFFAECGARSVVDGARVPSAYANDGDYDGAVQANYLDGVVRAFEGRTWWGGLLWWKWDEQQRRAHYDRPGGDTGFTIKGKPAEAVMRRWCAAPS